MTIQDRPEEKIPDVLDRIILLQEGQRIDLLGREVQLRAANLATKSAVDETAGDNILSNDLLTRSA